MTTTTHHSSLSRYHYPCYKTLGVRGMKQVVLRCRLPRELFRFQLCTTWLSVSSRQPWSAHWLHRAVYRGWLMLVTVGWGWLMLVDVLTAIITGDPAVRPTVCKSPMKTADELTGATKQNYNQRLRCCACLRSKSWSHCDTWQSWDSWDVSRVGIRCQSNGKGCHIRSLGLKVSTARLILIYYLSI